MNAIKTGLNQFTVLIPIETSPSPFVFVDLGVRLVLARAAKEIAPKLHGVDAVVLEKAMSELRCEYTRRNYLAGVGGAVDAKRQLLNVEKNANALLASLRLVGPAVWVLGEPEEDEALSFTGDLPFRLRLEDLAKQAALRITRIEKVTRGKGGRKSLGARLLGSPDDWLAESCVGYAEVQGCHSQAVALRMVQAIKSAEYGDKAMSRRKDTKPSKDKGRKSIQKVAQIKQ